MELENILQSQRLLLVLEPITDSQISLFKLDDDSCQPLFINKYIKVFKKKDFKSSFSSSMISLL